MKKFKLATGFILLVTLATFLNMIAGAPSRTDKLFPNWALDEIDFSIINLAVEQRKIIR